MPYWCGNWAGLGLRIGLEVGVWVGSRPVPAPTTAYCGKPAKKQTARHPETSIKRLCKHNPFMIRPGKALVRDPLHRRGEHNTLFNYSQFIATRDTAVWDVSTNSGRVVNI